MKITISKELTKKLTKEEAILVLVGKGINNYSVNSRSIVKELKNYKSESGINIPNVNPVVNKFQLFIAKNNFDGIFFDLDKVDDEVVVDLHKDSLVLREKSTDSTSEFGLQEGSKITNSTTNTVLILKEPETMEAESKGDAWQLAEQFAKDLESVFGGRWELKPFDEKNTTIVFEDLVKKNARNEKKQKSKKGIKKRRAESLGLVDKNTLTFFLHEKIKQKVLKYYPDVDLGNELLISNSASLKFGDYSTNVVFRIAGTTGEKPHEIARELGVKLSNETDLTGLFASIVSAPNGFVNFFVDEKFLLEFIEKSNAVDIDLPKNKNILIESPSANPNKPLHVGHLLNVCLGKSLGSIFSKLGFKVHYDNIINDKGLPISKLIWAFKNYALDSSPESEGLKPDQFVGKYYALGAQKFDESDEVESEIRKILRDWEAGDEEIVGIWKKLINWAIDGQSETIARIGEEMGHMWFESDIYEKGKQIILEYIDGEKIVQTEDGAVIGKIEDEYGVGDVVLVKSDGTSLYHTQDVYLTMLKIEKFKPWKAIWIVGNEQIAHFQKLFSVIDMLNLLPIDNLYHLAYGFVFGKDGKKMSSRTGEALCADELLDMMRDAVLKLGKGVDEKNAEVVGLGALKYAFLSSDPYKDMKFDINKAVMFNGRSGPYIMYAYARASNILKKVGDLGKKKIGSFEFTDLDKEILLKCVDYSNVVVNSANNFSPSILAEYLYDLAKLFNQMYETENVLSAKGDELLIRLAIVRHVKAILGDGLNLLKIEKLEKM